MQRASSGMIHAFIYLFRIWRPATDYLGVKVTHVDFQMKMEDMHLSGPDNTKLEVNLQSSRASAGGCVGPDLFLCLTCLHFQALVHDIYSELVEDACLGLCFEVHRAVKQGYFFLDETDQESMKEFGGFETSPPPVPLCFSSLYPIPSQKSWISPGWTYLARCTISGKTRSASVRTASA